MTIISRAQSLQRWDTLPENLREGLFSEVNSDFIWKTCEGEHIPDEKIYDVSRIAGYVLMGFLHPEDMADEVKESLGIDKKLAETISNAINQRIFSPIRPDLDKIYQPLSKMEVAGPTIIQDIGPAPVSLGGTTPFTVKPPAPSMPSAPAFTAPKSDLSQQGWSKVAPGAPMLQFDASRIAPPPMAPKPSAPPPAPVQKPVAAAGGTMGEFERMKIGTPKPIGIPPAPTMPSPAASMPQPPQPPKPPQAPGAPVAPATPTAPSAPAAPAPFMLHEDTSFSPLQKSADFHLSRPDEGAEMKMNPLGPSTSGGPVKPAVLELGNNPTSSAPKPSTPSGMPPMVHYTEFKGSNIGEVPPSGPGRNVSEITSVEPKPQPPTQAPTAQMPTPLAPTPAPAKPAQMPNPPQNPSAPGPADTKVIKKDYL